MSESAMNDSERARYIIEHSVHMIVATSGSDGKPWVSPVFLFTMWTTPSTGCRLSTQSTLTTVGNALK